MARMNNVCGLVLAAGRSSRMGRYKPLLAIDGVTAIERIIDTLSEVGLQQPVVVTGYNRESLLPILIKKNVDIAYNKDFDKGMFESLKTGLRACKAPADGFLLMLVDIPLVTPDIINLILEKHREYPDRFIVPCFQGKKGHPLFIPSKYKDEIISYEGEGGLKAITSKYEAEMIRLEVGCESVVLDMDTPEGYEEVLEYSLALKDGSIYSLNELLEGRRLFLIRHGETKQHKEKIFMGQYDVALSEKGRLQAIEAGERLRKYDLRTDRIYSSDLIRATETAELIANLLNFNVIYNSNLREMSLGEWDGRPISEIKSLYPEEYRKRGENLVLYKFGNRCENFYDLKYRVVKGIKKILKEDKNSDLVLVVHSGVIKVLLSEVNKTDLSDEIEKHIANGEIGLIDKRREKHERSFGL
jgi:broad specificity phosphatase PhoE/CTP:molybdopterin cytidylyltransferase MocA